MSQTCLSNNRGVALILTFIIMTTLIIIGSSFIALVTFNTRNVGAQTNNSYAFYLAEAGLNKAIYYLLNTAPDSSTDGSWRTTAYPAAAGAGTTDPQEESLGDGTYTMWVETSGSNVLISARGSINSINRIVRQTVTVGVGDIEVFDYAMHSTANIQFQNSEGTVTGDLDAVASVQQEDDMTIVGTITESSTHVFPTVDYTSYETLAGANTVSGNHTFTAGTYSGIWYVDGNVDIDSSVTFNGTVVATGKITLDKKGDSITLNPTSPYPALIAQSSISGDEITNLTINGLIFSEGGASFDKLDATATFNGSIIAGGNVSLKNGSGNFTITYDSDLSSNPPPHFSVPGGGVTVVNNSWTEL